MASSAPAEVKHCGAASAKAEAKRKQVKKKGAYVLPNAKRLKRFVPASLL
jgi:hypothetical protein